MPTLKPEPCRASGALETFIRITSVTHKQNSQSLKAFSPKATSTGNSKAPSAQHRCARLSVSTQGAPGTDKVPRQMPSGCPAREFGRDMSIDSCNAREMASMAER
eukprot:CAMPEP_0179012848 /NCGR_PEP_ID=MMETSP0796-20121207/1416_1 /TAXON_ID=73915 /ORGANISM="Pyrodinium bahamense, Strain pbaha01" /LENGTH=104 /DNA_ID=CAMNT_0020708321 /DNA_START=287 /DNA_END=598 /DNA_ORIENTATION=-